MRPGRSSPSRCQAIPQISHSPPIILLALWGLSPVDPPMQDNGQKTGSHQDYEYAGGKLPEGGHRQLFLIWPQLAAATEVARRCSTNSSVSSPWRDNVSPISS